jgi:hypothetical protein
MHDLIKKFVADNATMETLLEVGAQAELLVNSYAHFGVEQPEWLVTARERIRSQIEARKVDIKANRVRQIQAQLQGLETPAEKRKRLEAEMAALSN